MNKDFYSILGIEKNSTIDQIKQAYKKLAIQYHPDKNPGNEEIFHQIQEAYEVLSDEEKRKHYDLTNEVLQHPTDIMVQTTLSDTLHRIVVGVTDSSFFLIIPMLTDSIENSLYSIKSKIERIKEKIKSLEIALELFEDNGTSTLELYKKKTKETIINTKKDLSNAEFEKELYEKVKSEMHSIRYKKKKKENSKEIENSEKHSNKKKDKFLEDLREMEIDSL